MPRCKNCKEKFKAKKFNWKWCSKTECNDIGIKETLKKSRELKWKKEKAIMKENLMTISDYIKLAQIAFNAFIRDRDKGNKCISCDKEIKGVRHASHYLSAGNNYSVRFDEDNVFVSCYKCNVMLSGNQLKYRERLIDLIGVDKVEALEIKAKETVNFTREELQQITKKYRRKIKELKNK